MQTQPSIYPLKSTKFALLIVAALSVLVYLPGLEGPFLFDDHIHIRQNVQVHINDFSADSLAQAWNSSFNPPPTDRPLAQLTFGVNHAFTGLSTQAFKATNLAIHLVNGWLAFLFARSLMQAYSTARQLTISRTRIEWFAVAVAAIWLLHPLNLSPVLYIVQRMTELSALFVLLALWLYVSGRLAIAENRAGVVRVLVAFPIALLGVLGKENAVLFPVFLLVLEFTLLRSLSQGQHRKFLLSVGIVGVALPLIGGIAYLATHPELYGYASRPFSMEERLLTQARALWFYLHMFITPILHELALFHDDFPISRELFIPVSTGLALVAWSLTVFGSLFFARRWPVFAFGVLFFLAGHALESTIFPLEMVFEHRNYLPLIAPSFLLAYFLLIHLSTYRLARFMPVILVILVGTYAIATHVRAIAWSSTHSITLSEVEHHPDSKRANFKAAQHFMTLLDDPQVGTEAYIAARTHFQKITELDPGHPNALFGLIVLNLHVGKQPLPEWVDTLAEQLTNETVDATRFTTSQFSFLVRWHLGNNYPLPVETMNRLFDAVLANPRLALSSKAGVFAARAAYVDRVLKQPEKALPFAKGAVRYWPQRWHYRKRYAQLLMRLQRWEEALAVLQEGTKQPLAENQRQEALHLVEAAESRRQGRLD